MTTTTVTFAEVPLKAFFRHNGRTYHKLAISLAHAADHTAFIFQAETPVERDLPDTPHDTIDNPS